MTVIVAAKRKDGRVTVAADRQSTLGTGGQFENAEPKLWVDGKYVFGCAGDVRVAQLLIATRDRFAVIYENGAVLADRSGRTAIGSGAPEALGYLGNQGPWKASDVATAVSRAAVTDAGVSGPVSIADTRSLEVITEDE